VRRRFAFVGRRSLPGRSLAAGLIMVAAGLAFNLVLLVRWLGGNPSPSGQGYGLAALSQALIILGATLVSFGAVSRCLVSQRGLLPGGRPRAGVDRRPTPVAPGTAPAPSATPRP
jgi:hypothetical protein